jgi:DNA-directed RNA polymerase subunit beta
VLEIFDLADEVRVSKAGLKRVLGRKLVARVLKTWFEDFVDEDTGEVVSIERNEVLLDRDVVLEKDHIDIIMEAGVKTKFKGTKQKNKKNQITTSTPLQTTHTQNKMRQK